MWFANDGDDWLNEALPVGTTIPVPTSAPKGKGETTIPISLDSNSSDLLPPLHTLPEAPPCAIRTSQ